MTLTNYKKAPFITLIIILSGIHGFIMNYFLKNGITLSITVTIFISTVIFLYDRYIWKVFPQLLNIKDVSGRYKGVLTSSFNNKTCSIIIEIMQTASTIHINQYTANDKGETQSNSESSNISMKNNGLCEVDFSFRNDGDEVRDELDSHIGFCKLRFDRKRKNISGFYFTNREKQTKGTISAAKVNNSLKGRR